VGDLTKNFSRHEFACKCACGYDEISLVLVRRLQGMRNLLGSSITVTSGCRCEQHNRYCGGSENSDHLAGEGVDVFVDSSRTRFRLIGLAYVEGFPRIGIAKTFIHLGINPENDKDVLWLY